MLSEVPDLHLVAEGPVDESGLALVARFRPDVVITDVRADGSGGVDVVRVLAVRHPGTKTILFTRHADHDVLWEALGAGARGLVLKDVPGAVLVGALRQVAAGDPYVDERLTPAVLRQLARPRAHGVLSERERQILQLLADGASSRDVSEHLVVSVETVKTHVKHILTKLGAKHRTQAVAIGIRRSLIR